jgi:CBS domain-containing protein
MVLTSLPTKLPTLEQVIDPAPLIVGPDTAVLAVMMQMNQIRDATCSLAPNAQAAEVSLTASCALVVKDEKLLGLLTERDIVKLSAAGRDLATVAIADVMTRSVINLVLGEAQTVLTALALLQQHQIRHLPVLDQQGQLVGLITPYSIRCVLQPANLLKLRRVAEVMTTAMISAPPTAAVLSVAQLMSEHHISCVVIYEAMSEAESKVYPLGMITERDIVQFQILQLDLAQIQAQAVMSTPLFFAHPQDSLWDAHQSMQRRRVRRLGVVNDQGELVGLLTQTHLLEVFDPIELSGVVDTLQQQVEERTTQLERINQQLRDAQEALEDRVQERTEKVLQANAQLQQEIQERQQAENTLRETLQSLEFQKFALDQSAIVAITDRQGTITEINDQFCQISQYSRAELVGQNHRIINTPDTFLREKG